MKKSVLYMIAVTLLVTIGVFMSVTIAGNTEVQQGPPCPNGLPYVIHPYTGGNYIIEFCPQNASYLTSNNYHMVPAFPESIIIDTDEQTYYILSGEPQPINGLLDVLDASGNHVQCTRLVSDLYPYCH